MAKHKRQHGGLMWPTGPVSKAQWRFLYASKDPRVRRWAHTLTERGERLGPKVHYRSLPYKRRGPGARSLAYALKKK